MQYNWKGNVREVENVIERAINLMEGNMITIANLPDHILERYETRGKDTNPERDGKDAHP